MIFLMGTRMQLIKLIDTDFKIVYFLSETQMKIKYADWNRFKKSN